MPARAPPTIALSAALAAAAGAALPGGPAAAAGAAAGSLPASAIALAVADGGAAPARAAGALLTARVTGFRSTAGMLQCTLFRDGEGFPDRPEEALVTQRAPIRADRTAMCQFAGLPPGDYAVGALHDENGNGKIDFSFLGIPTEGYGMSNNRLHALRAPSWDESRFRVDGADLTIELRLKYH